MYRRLIILTGIITLTFCSFSQDMGEKTIKIMQECECNEILMISGALQKSYTGVWLKGIEFEDGFIQFSKGAARHKWNPEKIVFIEKDRDFIRVYLEQSKE